MDCSTVFQGGPVSQAGQRGLLIASPASPHGFAELLLCLLCLYHKLAHCTRYNVNNVSVSSLSTQGHTTLWRTKRTWCWVVEQKLNLPALKENTSTQTSIMVLSSVTMMNPASVFVGCCRVSSDCFLMWTVPSWCLLDQISWQQIGWMEGFSFLTFNMEVSCAISINWANQDFLLLLIILSLC